MTNDMTAEQNLAVEAIILGHLEFVKVLDRYCHPNRETALAKTNIEQGMMWALKAVTA